MCVWVCVWWYMLVIGTSAHDEHSDAARRYLSLPEVKVVEFCEMRRTVLCSDLRPLYVLELILPLLKLVFLHLPSFRV